MFGNRRYVVETGQQSPLAAVSVCFVMFQRNGTRNLRRRANNVSARNRVTTIEPTSFSGVALRKVDFSASGDPPLRLLPYGAGHRTAARGVLCLAFMHSDELVAFRT